jgi:hypothetical protein
VLARGPGRPGLGRDSVLVEFCAKLAGVVGREESSAKLTGVVGRAELGRDNG